jgi:hypothetical protein
MRDISILGIIRKAGIMRCPLIGQTTPRQRWLDVTVTYLLLNPRKICTLCLSLHPLISAPHLGECQCRHPPGICSLFLWFQL